MLISMGLVLMRFSGFHYNRLSWTLSLILTFWVNNSPRFWGVAKGSRVNNKYE
jgi:hypothetical protein